MSIRKIMHDFSMTLHRLAVIELIRPQSSRGQRQHGLRDGADSGSPTLILAGA